MKKLFWIGIILVFCVPNFVVTTHTDAANGATIYSNGWYNISSEICSEAGIFLGYTLTSDQVDATNIYGTEFDWAAMIIMDGNGVALHAMWTIHEVSGTLYDSSDITFPFGTAEGALHDITARPIIAKLYDTPDFSSYSSAQGVFDALVNSSYPLLAEFTYDPALFNVGCASLPLIGGSNGGGNSNGGTGPLPPPPPRPGIDTQNADALIVPVLDSPEGMGLVIWGIMTDTGEGYLAFRISSATLADLPEFPDDPVEIACTPDHRYCFYKLSTGEYQLNIGPDIEGKVQVVIFDGVPPTTVYRRDFNIYDIID